MDDLVLFEAREEGLLRLEPHADHGLLTVSRVRVPLEQAERVAVVAAHPRAVELERRRASAAARGSDDGGELAVGRLEHDDQRAGLRRVREAFEEDKVRPAQRARILGDAI